MACTGHCNHCPAHGGYIPGIAAYVWTNDPIGTGDNVEEDDFNEMASVMNGEFTRRSFSPSGGFPPTAKVTTDIVYSLDYRTLRDHLVRLCRQSTGIAWSPTALYCSYGALFRGGLIQDESTEEMRVKVNELRAECVCNCNYACTCNCNYCVCNCNYACVCNCNYSDKRLKKEICYL